MRTDHAIHGKRYAIFYNEFEIVYNIKSYDLLRQSFTKYIETCIFIYKTSKFLPSGARPPHSPTPSSFKTMWTVIASIELHNFNSITSNIAL
jgi:hypothetical protein